MSDGSHLEALGLVVGRTLMFAPSVILMTIRRQPPKLNRRDALRLLGIGTVSSLTIPHLPVRDDHGSRRGRDDVLVIGAGFAGLAAARELLRSGKRVAVLEARNRVGGRVKGGVLAGHAVDVGGMWVGPTQTRLLALLGEFGLSTTPQFEGGKAVSEINGKRTYPEGEGSGLDREAQAEYDRIIRELNTLSEQVPLDAPWTMPNAEELDKITVEEWFNAKVKNRDALAFLRLMTRTIFTTDPFQMSFLYFLFFLHSGDDFETLMGFQNAAQAFLVKETMHELAVRMAREAGKSIQLETPVSAISQDETGVLVKTERGEWQGDYVVVAVPVPLGVRISYDPPLPSQRDILAQHMPMGSVIKCLVAYERPFWRDKGLNGLTWNDAPPTAGFFDITPPEGKPGILGAFIEAHNALQWTGQPKEERKKLIVGRIVELLGKEGANPIDYEDQDWPSDPWSRGCYGGSMGPGVMTTVGRSIRQPHGRIHWAGTETSTKWMGYIEGAIRSGERAAAEVLERYTHQHSSRQHA